MWSLYQEENSLLPLKFSNGKTQEDVVNEALKLISQGTKIIFIKGVCGTGKSAIALNIAKELGKSCIVVPGKTLQNQYKEDYEKNKYLLKNGKKLKISVITGRNNHKCKYLEEKNLPVFKEEKNLFLNEIFEKKERGEKDNKKTADNIFLPCKIEIKEKNFNRIKEYLKQNRNYNENNFQTIKDIKRITVASLCPYWSPVFPEKIELNGKNFEGAKKRSYLGLNGTKFIFYQRKPGCKFYEQFNSYIDSDVLVFNSLKYKLESSMNRKPATEVDIIDECDEFLDSFSNQRIINIERLQNSINQLSLENPDATYVLKKIYKVADEVKNDQEIQHAVFSKDILSLKKTPVYDLLKIILDSQEFLFDLDEDSYLFDILETARMFDEFFDESYLTFTKKENNLLVELVTTNLAKRFKELVEKNKVIIMMSGTIHSEAVLKRVFGMENFRILEAETQQQGDIEVVRTGLEMDCKYENFSSGRISKEKYLKALDKCIETAKKPVLIHINSYYDLPSENEIKMFKLKNVISREELREMQEQDKENKSVQSFKRKEIDVLFSTKCTRGIDFPGDECNSIIFTKYPNPDVKSPFWTILKKTNPEYYWEFYKDKAQRELLQRIYRGLRFKGDHVYLLSPDERVLKAFE